MRQNVKIGMGLLLAALCAGCGQKVDHRGKTPLVEVGRSKLSVEGFRRVIEQKDRCCAGSSVPGHALFLVDITYPADLFYD